jgi:hypothetical protein
VLIGACIPCLYPLVKKIFGVRVLGSTPDGAGQQATLVTIGGTPPGGRRRGPKAPQGVSDIDTINTANTTSLGGTTAQGGESSEDSNWYYTMLQDDGRQQDGAGLWAAEAVEQLELQQRRAERDPEEGIQIS